MYRLDDQGIGVQISKIITLVLEPTQPPVQRALSEGLKWLHHEADHSPPSSAKTKNAWSYT
jgi:hypothetical protein